MKRTVSVAMNAGTFRMVTSTPLISPISVPSSRQRIADVTTPRSRKFGANSLAKTTATRPYVEPTERSRSLLTMTKVTPTAMMATREVSRSSE